MAGASLSNLSEILREVYMGPARIEAVPVKAWTCPKHKTPVSDKYEQVCEHERLTGESCPDPWECPHVVSVKVKDGCPDCKTSEWATVLDAMTGEEVWEAKLFTTMEWEMHQTVSLLQRELTRDRYGDG